MQNRYNWYSNIFLIPRLENAIVKIFTFLLIIQIIYLLYFLHSISYTNNYYYILGDSNKYYSLDHKENPQNINNIIKTNLIKKYIKYFEENTHEKFIKNLSSDEMYSRYINKEPYKNHTIITNITLDSQHSYTITIKQNIKKNNIIQETNKYNIHLKYEFIKKKNNFYLNILSYDKTEI